MPRFFFELCDGGEVYHDAQGTNLPGLTEAQDRAFELLRKVIPQVMRRNGGEYRYRDLAYTVRDGTGRQLMKIRFELGTPAETESPSAEGDQH
ncbi:hypothetical protein LB553_06060 [Mesorhizobium sp. CA8]|nr:hypothetical protein [Mesorhizobium sp. CA8]